MAGLSSMDQLNNKLAAMLIKDYRKPARLIILSPAKPPGSETLAQCRAGDLAQFQGRRGERRTGPVSGRATGDLHGRDRHQCRASLRESGRARAHQGRRGFLRFRLGASPALAGIMLALNVAGMVTRDTSGGLPRTRGTRSRRKKKALAFLSGPCLYCQLWLLKLPSPLSYYYCGSLLFLWICVSAAQWHPPCVDWRKRY